MFARCRGDVVAGRHARLNSHDQTSPLCLGNTIKSGDGVAGRNARVSFAPPGRHDQGRRWGGGPRCAIKQVTFARSNESPLRRPGDTIKSGDRVVAGPNV